MTTASRTLARNPRVTLIGVIGFAAAVAAASQIAIPMPGTMVPFTLQPMLVILAGMWLGPAAGTTSMVVYLAAGAAGLPVFAPLPMGASVGIARFLGPTGGYLLAYPAAAFVAGALTQRASSLGWRWLAATAGMLMIYLGGVAQLTLLNHSVVRAVALGVLPFAAFDLVKAFIAAAITSPRVTRRSA